LNSDSLKSHLCRRLKAVDQMEISPHYPESSSLWEPGTTDFDEDWWRNVDYDRRQRIIANAPIFNDRV